MLFRHRLRTKKLKSPYIPAQKASASPPIPGDTWQDQEGQVSPVSRIPIHGNKVTPRTAVNQSQRLIADQLSTLRTAFSAAQLPQIEATIWVGDPDAFAAAFAKDSFAATVSPFMI